MYPFERKEKILNKLRAAGQITISRDAKVFGVSTSTLHRDLEDLEKQGLIKKVTGGAIPAESIGFETHFDIRMKTRLKEKEEIARKAVEAVQDDTSIFLDHSTTTLFLARELRRKRFKNLVVLTNSLAVPFELGGKKGIQVLATGGVVEKEFQAFSGRWVLDAVGRLNLHQLFVSVGAISTKLGLMTQIPFIHELFPQLLTSGGAANVLADSSKFFKIGTFQLLPLDSSFTIFTDRNLPEDIRKEIQSQGPKIV
jgi:DeoR/GlpR family transcriptional regulator of sugar metabolism